MLTESRDPQYVINSSAPIRICDNGGWTDTWFAQYGRVFNIGVNPCVEVQIAVFKDFKRRKRIIINALNFADRYEMDLNDSNKKKWIKHPLIEATISSMGVPKDFSCELSIYSRAPSGASTGTSAAVSVALIGALDKLNLGHMTKHEVAYAAHSIETEILGQQSGIQDQLCSAYGGINFIEMDSFPHAEVTRLSLPDPIWWELERRIVLVYLGKSHHSSSVHESVVRTLEKSGRDDLVLEKLRQTAIQSRTALENADFQALGEAMKRNNATQRELHQDLINHDAEIVIETAEAHGALGWKVNGAGGEGGSVTILCGPQVSQKHAIINELELNNQLYRYIPIQLNRRGLHVWKSE